VGAVTDVSRDLNQGLNNTFSHWDAGSCNRFKAAQPTLATEPFYGEFKLYVTHADRICYGALCITSKHLVFTAQFPDALTFVIPIAEIASIQMALCTLTQPPSPQPGVFPPKIATWGQPTAQLKPNALHIFTKDHNLHHLINPTNFEFVYGIIDFLWRNPPA
jgi:hypothetical protein